MINFLFYEITSFFVNSYYIEMSATNQVQTICHKYGKHNDFQAVLLFP